MAEWTGVSGRRVIITGATSGIGLAAARALAARGARLSIVARSETRAARAAAAIREAAGGGAEVDVLLADLASLASVRGLAAEILDRYPRIDVLANNAGAVFMGRHVSADGIELTWAVNHLAPFLLTNLLVDRLRASAPGRVVATASGAHRSARQIPFEELSSGRASGGFRRYAESKLANILFTTELARRLEGTGVTANCFHPGFVASGFNRNNGALMSFGMTLARPFARTPERGADTLVWLSDSPEVAGETGGYFVDRRRATPSEPARSAELARRLWEFSERQVG